MNDGRRAACTSPAAFSRCRETTPTGNLPRAVGEGYHCLRSDTPLRRPTWIGPHDSSVLRNPSHLGTAHTAPDTAEKTTTMYHHHFTCHAGRSLWFLLICVTGCVGPKGSPTDSILLVEVGTLCSGLLVLLLFAEPSLLGNGGGLTVCALNSGTSPAFFQSEKPSRHTSTSRASETVASVSFNSCRPKGPTCPRWSAKYQM